VSEQKARNESEIEHTIKHRQDGMRLVRRQSMRGDGVCGASLAMDALAREMGIDMDAQDMEEGEW
jgi:hypothetical protein